MSGPVPDGRHHLLIPASVVLCALLLYGAHVSFGVVLGVAAAFLTLYLAAPGLARRSRDAFDRDALTIRASAGPRAQRLLGRLDSAWALRLLGAPADVHVRRAMIADEAGRPAVAREFYRRAIAAWEGDPPLSMLLGLATASYLAGDDVDAVMSYQKVLDRGGSLPRVHARLAHATLRAGLPRENVPGWLEVAGREARDDGERAEVGLLTALDLAARGERGEARGVLGRIDLGDPPAEHLERLRDEVRAALETRTRP